MGTFKALVDWNGDGFICRWCQRTDLLQSIRTWLSDPLDLSTWRSEPTYAPNVTIDIGTAAGSTVNPRYTPFFGKEYFVVDVTSATNEGIKIFALSGAYDITTTINKRYTAVFWITTENDTTMSYRARLYTNSYTVNAAQVTGTTTQAQWTRVEVTYVASASNNMVLQIVNTTGSARRFFVAGVMVFESTGTITAPQGYNTGAATDIYDDITPDVKTMNWQVGMFKPYQQMSDEGQATLMLDNSARLYTPENTSSPLYDYIQPTLMFEIGHWLGEAQKNYRQMYTGQLASPALTLQYQTAAENSGKTEVSLKAISNKLWLDTQAFEYPTTTDNIGLAIKAILGYTNLAGAGAFDYIGRTGARVGTVTNYAPQANDTAWKVIGDLVAVEEGKFYFDRGGTVNLLSQYYNFGTATGYYGSWNEGGTVTAALAGTIAETGSYKPCKNLDYAYGANYINSVRVTVHPRTSNTSGTLWQNTGIDLDIPAGETYTMPVRLRDSEGRYTSASSLTISLLTYSSGTATTTVTANGGKATFTFANAGTISAVLSSLAITGASASQRNDISLQFSSAGTGLYGLHMQTIDLPACGSARVGRRIAKHILNRDDSFTGYVYSVPFQNAGDGTSNAHQLAWEIGTRLKIKIDSLGHDRNYWVIGERHQVVRDGDVHHTTFAFEPRDNYYG